MLLAAVSLPSAVGLPLDQSSRGVNRREPIIRPGELGEGTIDGLQYGDPTEGLAMVSPPPASSTGAAQLSYPFVIPPGRGITPDVRLTYASDGGNGWAGLGWDLSVGEINVDTRFGAPHYSQTHESETYLIDGDVLVPTANDGPWELREEGDRQDYTRQTETEYEQVIRHDADDGDGRLTDDYYWEVRDKKGNIRWYGGYPDEGGPFGNLQAGGETIDRSAIVYDDDGNAVRWMLSAMRDVGVNVIRYHYETVEYARTTNGWTPQDCDPDGSVMCGRHTFLSRIDYTEAAEVAPDPAWEGDAPYQVHLLRESVVDPSATVRPDPAIDASGRYIDVLVDRLARVEVRHGDPLGGAARSYDTVAVRYDLGYGIGPFGKSLLTSVTQVGTPPDDSATHRFRYNDEVLADDGSYDGFAERSPWDTGEDLGDRDFLDQTVSLGALGASESNSAEGHAYVGFNPLVPQKTGSFGGSIQIGGGGTEALSEWIDLNGDSLPDKVFRDGGDVRFRLNQSGPDGGTDFTDDDGVDGGLPRLSRETNVNFQLAVESHVVVTAIFGLGGQVSIGDSYFTDVNADGLPDFVSSGSVWFNHLGAGGVPTFEEGSENTTIPLPGDGATPTVGSDALTDVQADLDAQSPPIDTVRRWTAQLTGTISINAPVTLAHASSPDGVRVAVQHNGDELAAANVLTSATTAFPTPIVRNVVKGDQLYFRVGSMYDGRKDEVQWAPIITYTAVAGIANLGTVGPDVNGLSQLVYSAKSDFTLAGRPSSLAVMPFSGQVEVTATIDKSAATTDDLRMVVLHDGVAVTMPANATIPAGTTGDRTVTVSFAVDGPVYPTAADPGAGREQDTVEVYLAADSPIDLTAVEWQPRLVYTSATDRNGDPVAVLDAHGEPTIAIDLLPEIEQYPNRSGMSVSAPWTATTTGTYDLAVRLNRGFDSPAGQVVATVKTGSGALVAKAAVDLGPSSIGTQTVVFDLNAPISAGTAYFIDLMIRKPALSDTTALASAALRPNGATDATTDVAVPAELRWRGRQSIFPLAYRGWAVAGYTAGGTKGTEPIDPDAFEVDEDRFDGANAPDGFNDLDDDPASDIEPAYAFLPTRSAPALPGGPVPIAGAHWSGPRQNHAASPTLMRTSRLGADSVDITSGVGGSGRAVTRVGLTAPSASLAIGIGPLGGSFGVSPSFGLVDFEDMNADGYPDVVTPGSVHFTDQRGAYLPGSTSVASLAVANQDLTFSASGGLSVKLVDIKGNAKGKTNASKGQSAGKGGDADDSSGGASVGGGLSASWTSPNASGGDAGVPSTYDGALSEIPDESKGGTAPIQIALADVNGDGLPDRVFTTPQGVFAQYNLGYRFTSQSVQLTTGGFQSMESYAGNVSFGFSTPWAEFSGGASTTWNYDQARYTWQDVNGDGILDQIRKRDGDTAPLVAFGTGSGVLSPVAYGDVEEVATTLVPAGQQVSFDRSSGIGAGFDFTVYIGPLCKVACYLVVNPGASFQNSVSSTQADLEDVNGDGYADSLSTTDDDELYVRLNNAGRTNLLETVENPIGGKISLAYERDGNTVAHPDTIWRLSRVATDDGRPGDGADVQATNYAYSGLAYDRVHRQSLGYSSVTATEMDTTTGPEQPLRVTETAYHNENVFVAGLERSVTTRAPGGALLRRAETTWTFRDVRDVGASFDVLAKVNPLDLTLIGDTTSVASRGRSIAPLATRLEEESYEGGVLAQSTHQTFDYDGLGNALVQTDVGEPEDPNDDLVATYDYADCLSAASTGAGGLGCPTVPTKVSPIWSAALCPTWVSLPVAVRITNGKTGTGEVVYRHRDGRTDVCDNASMTYLEERIDEGATPETAVTQLTYDEWGSYDRIVYPPDDDGTSYAVRYVYDQDGHGNVADVTEYDLDEPSVATFLDDGSVGPGAVTGLRSTATFDPLAGRVASRTDANANTVEYTYDSLGRIETIGSPRPEDTDPLVSFEYRPSAAGYAYAVARHLDIFNPGDTIDTYTFVDGTGRRTQTKRDARLFQGAGVTPVIGRAVSGATNFDALGRAVEQFYPSKDTQASATTYETTPSAVDPERTVWDLRDRPVTITAPGARVTSFAYGDAPIAAGGPIYRTTTVTAPNLRATTTFVDAREITRGSKDQPVGAAARLSVFDHDAMGQLRVMTDPVGNATSHTYDLLGRRTSTDTPDGGLVEFGFDPEGKLVEKTTPNLRDDGTSIVYQYELGRLTGIDYPAGTPDVTYAYGSPGDGVNGAGRVVREEDGSRIVTNQYAASGALAKQVAEMKHHDWFNADSDKSKFRWTTEWEYDGLGRMASMVYPDGEALTYDYDSGGLAESISGVEEGLEKVLVGYDAEGAPIYQDQPRTWTYAYLVDRQYDEFQTLRWEHHGNGVTTEYTVDPDTRWLARQQSLSPNRSVSAPQHREIQDLNYQYDSVGNPTEYRNALPPALSSEFGGTTVHRYRYDARERLVGSSGIYDLASRRHQRYELSISYDDDGNVVSKDQYDAVVKKPMPAEPTSSGPLRGELPDADTTYKFTRPYDEPAPHQATSDPGGDYFYDRNGNLTGILEDAPDKWLRRLEWDATDRLRLIDDDGSVTEYRYDDTGQRTIERGPNGGETAFVNPWVTTRNKNEMYKHIWVDDRRLAAQRDDGPYEELKRYFIHTDLQGSTNMVTDYRGDTFQHHEYFPTGQVWIDEASTIYRTPYQYAGGYADDARDIINFGARWYDQDRELFYSPDPVLYDDPSAIMKRPALAAAYAYAGSNPVTNIDPSGLEFFTARNRNEVTARYDSLRKYIARNPAVAAAVVENTRLPKFLVRRGLTADPKTDRLQVLSELLDNKPIIEIDLSEGTVRLSFTVGKQFKFPRQSNQPSAGAPASAPMDASANGAPAAGSGPPAADAAGSGPAAVVANGGAPSVAQPADSKPPPPARPRAASAPPSLSGGVARSDQ